MTKKTSSRYINGEGLRALIEKAVGWSTKESWYSKKKINRQSVNRAIQRGVISGTIHRKLMNAGIDIMSVTLQEKVN